MAVGVILATHRTNLSINKTTARVLKMIPVLFCHVERSETSRSVHERSMLALSERFFTAFRMTLEPIIYPHRYPSYPLYPLYPSPLHGYYF